MAHKCNGTCKRPHSPGARERMRMAARRQGLLLHRALQLEAQAEEWGRRQFDSGLRLSLRFREGGAQ